MLLLFQLGQPNDYLFVTELFIRFTMRAFRERLFIPVCDFLGWDAGFDCIGDNAVT